MSLNRPGLFLSKWAEQAIIDQENSKEKTVIIPPETGADAGNGKADIRTGFPAITMRSVLKGGVPPWGSDHNGILYKITEALQWIQAGGMPVFDQNLCNKIGGYAEGAFLESTNQQGVFWVSIIHDNPNNPDTTNSPDNGWWKLSLQELQDLEARLKAAENSIQDIYNNQLPDVRKKVQDAQDGVNDIYNNQLPDVRKKAQDAQDGVNDIYNNKLPLKADWNGHDYVDFNTSKLYTSQYQTYGNSTQFFDKSGKEWLLNNTLGTGENQLVLTGYQGDGSRGDASVFRVKYSWIEMKGDTFSFKMDPNLGNGIWFADQKGDILWQQKYTKDYFHFWKKIPGQAESLDFTVFKVNGNKTMSIDPKTTFNNGTVGAKGDIAEYYEADSSNYKVGQLFMIGGEAEVTLCNDPLSCFGVYSTNPQHLLRAPETSNEKYIPIALMGCVPVLIDGPIKKGQRITATNKGTAKASEDSGDVILGRALESNSKKGTKLVECFVRAVV